MGTLPVPILMRMLSQRKTQNGRAGCPSYFEKCDLPGVKHEHAGSRVTKSAQSCSYFPSPRFCGEREWGEGTSCKQITARRRFSCLSSFDAIIAGNSWGF